VADRPKSGLELELGGIALLVFGPKKLPELGKGFGEGIRGFKAAIKGDKEADTTPDESKTAPPNGTA
jgi:sec-independent protein translocase protein TatA